MLITEELPKQSVTDNITTYYGQFAPEKQTYKVLRLFQRWETLKSTLPDINIRRLNAIRPNDDPESDSVISDTTTKLIALDTHTGEDIVKPVRVVLDQSGNHGLIYGERDSRGEDLAKESVSLDQLKKDSEREHILGRSRRIVKRIRKHLKEGLYSVDSSDSPDSSETSEVSVQEPHVSGLVIESGRLRSNYTSSPWQRHSRRHERLQADFTRQSKRESDFMFGLKLRRKDTEDNKLTSITSITGDLNSRYDVSPRYPASQPDLTFLRPHRLESSQSQYITTVSGFEGLLDSFTDFYNTKLREHFSVQPKEIIPFYARDDLNKEGNPLLAIAKRGSNEITNKVKTILIIRGPDSSPDVDYIRVKYTEDRPSNWRPNHSRSSHSYTLSLLKEGHNV